MATTRMYIFQHDKWDPGSVYMHEAQWWQGDAARVVGSAIELNRLEALDMCDALQSLLDDLSVMLDRQHKRLPRW